MQLQSRSTSLFALRHWPHDRNRVRVDANDRVTPEAPKVTVMHPEQRELSDHEEFNGWMAADETVEVRSRVRGHIQKVNFTDGQYVKKGDLLFELDPRPFQAEIGKASDSRRVFEAQKTAADKEEARLRLLETKGGASTQQVEKAEADAIGARGTNQRRAKRN